MRGGGRGAYMGGRAFGNRGFAGRPIGAYRGGFGVRPFVRRPWFGGFGFPWFGGWGFPFFGPGWGFGGGFGWFPIVGIIGAILFLCAIASFCFVMFASFGRY